MKKDPDVVVLEKYTSDMEAQVARLVLEAHDIPCALMRDDAGGMIPSMHLIYPVRLMVRSEDADEARRLLASGPDSNEGESATDTFRADATDDEPHERDEPDRGWSPD